MALTTSVLWMSTTRATDGSTRESSCTVMQADVNVRPDPWNSGGISRLMYPFWNNFWRRDGGICSSCSISRTSGLSSVLAHAWTESRIMLSSSVRLVTGIIVGASVSVVGSYDEPCGSSSKDADEMVSVEKCDWLV